MQKEIIQNALKLKEKYELLFFKLKKSGLLTLADNEFKLLNNCLIKLSGKERQKIIAISLEYIMRKLRNYGYDNSELQLFKKIILENWMILLENKEEVSPSDLYLKSLKEMEKFHKRLKNRKKNNYKLITGIGRMITSTGFLISDCIYLREINPTPQFLLASIYSGAILFYQGIDNFFE